VVLELHQNIKTRSQTDRTSDYISDFQAQNEESELTKTSVPLNSTFACFAGFGDRRVEIVTECRVSCLLSVLAVVGS